MERNQIRPSGYEQRARAIKMANVMERELQRERNKMMAGLRSEIGVSVLWRNGRIITHRLLSSEEPKNQPPYELLLQ
jgi:hypothetical protein